MKKVFALMICFFALSGFILGEKEIQAANAPAEAPIGTPEEQLAAQQKAEAVGAMAKLFGRKEDESEEDYKQRIASLLRVAQAMKEKAELQAQEQGQ